MKYQLFMFLLLLIFGGSLYANEDNHDHHDAKVHQDGDQHGDEDEHHNHDEPFTSHINNDLARQVGIETALATPQTLSKTVTIYGTLALGPEQLSHVRARFSGRVQAVHVSVGDTVKAGDLLARIESNESLKTYTLYAPISGLVIQRHANTGEATQDKVLFSIGNFEFLWAELRIYPAQYGTVKKAQQVTLQINNQRVKAKVEHIIPVLNKPYQLARVKLDNQTLALSPGLQVEAHIEVNRFSVPIAVTKNAIQTLNGREGVFVKHDNEYSFSPLTLGPADDDFVSVLDGLEPNTAYVTGNSYLIKADIGKSEAEHEH